MKKNQRMIILSALSFGMFGLTFQPLGAQDSSIGNGGTFRVCVGSPNPAENTKVCRPLASGNGDVCVIIGTGPACAGTLTINDN